MSFTGLVPGSASVASADAGAGAGAVTVVAGTTAATFFGRNYFSHGSSRLMFGLAAVCAAAAGLYYYLTRRDDDPPRGPPSVKGKLYKRFESSVKECHKRNEEFKERLSCEIKEEANTLYKTAKYGDALSLYDLAIEASPNILVNWTNRAACNIVLRKYQEVINDCTHVINQDYANQKAYYRRGQAYSRLGKYREALYDFTTLSVLESFRNENAVADSEKYVKLLAEEVQKTCGIVPKPLLPSPSVCSNFLASLTDLNFPDLGREFPEGSAENLFQMVVSLCRERNFDEAMELTKKVLATISSSSPFYEDALSLYVSFCMLSGMVDETAKFLDNLYALDPHRVTTTIQRSSICIERGETPEAKHILDLSLQTKPDDPYLNYHRGQVSFLRNEFPEAARFFQKSYEVKPDFIFAAIQFAVSAYKGGEESKALAIFETALYKFPKSSDLYNYHGELLLDRTDYKQAKTAFETSIKLNPQLVVAYINLAALYQLIGDEKKAEECYKSAATGDPRSELAIMHLASHLIHNGKVEEGIKTYERVYLLAKSTAELQTFIASKERSMANQEVSCRLPAELIRSCLASNGP